TNRNVTPDAFVRARGTIAGCGGSSIGHTRIAQLSSQPRVQRSGGGSGVENVFDARAPSTARAYESVGTARSRTSRRRFCRAIGAWRKWRTGAAPVYSRRAARRARERTRATRTPDVG